MPLHTVRSADELQGLLRRAGIKYTPIVTKGATPTVASLAVAVGGRPEDIVKTLIFRNGSGLFVAVVMSGPDRVDASRLEPPGKWRLASPQEALEVTGFNAGTVPPFFHETDVPVILDAAVLARESVYCGGGAETVSLLVGVKDLIAASRARVADVRLRQKPVV